MTMGPALRLMRFHKPVGIWLLWFPTAWALWLAQKGTPSFLMLLYFFLGTCFMRAAGCIVNDIADRHIDLHVQRTEMRPLTSGEISIQKAFSLLAALLFSALLILIQLPKICFYYALGALAITILYPFCKRFFEAPQLILGIAFSMGIPMAYAALNQPFNATMACLMVLNFSWIVAYDTLYAMEDRTDDKRIGVKSTALLFGDYWQAWIVFFQALTQTLWLIIAALTHASIIFYIAWGVGCGVLAYQHWLIRKPAQPGVYLHAFTTNALYGLILWLGIMLLKSTT